MKERAVPTFGKGLKWLINGSIRNKSRGCTAAQDILNHHPYSQSRWGNWRNSFIRATSLIKPNFKSVNFKTEFWKNQFYLKNYKRPNRHKVVEVTCQRFWHIPATTQCYCVSVKASKTLLASDCPKPAIRAGTLVSRRRAWPAWM